ncbi:MAG: hypothetical protein MI723_04935 [Caulobacterales bacterium]|nr:hypothetical protein [Caulobacterales bacterium]
MSSRAVMQSSMIVALCASLAGAASAQVPDWDRLDRDRYDQCLDRVTADPEAAYEDALIWRGEGGGVPARHCVAMALLQLGHTAEAAARLEAAATAPDGGDSLQRKEILLQAGNAWMIAQAPADAERAFTQGLAFKPGDPDLLIERARAHVEQDRLEAADRDLSDALISRPRDVRALRLRADTRLALGRLEGAESDIAQAVRLAPEDIETLVMRGKVREAVRVAAR